MRVISGTFRGLKLESPSGTVTRPTLDRVKEAVFSMLMPYICDADILDLFAGSGAMGIEAISRGAASAVFVDKDKNALNCIKKNISLTKCEKYTEVISGDSLNYLLSCNRKYDIIFIDPPYMDGIYSTVLKLIDEKGILSENGIIIVEWDYEYGFTENLYNFSLLKEKKYGRVGISVLKRGN